MKQQDNYQQYSNNINQIQPMSSIPNLLVTVRCRPFSNKDNEPSEGQNEVIKIINTNSILILSQSDNRGNSQIKENQFNFDHVFDKTSTQQDIYSSSTKPLLSGILEGYNATVFAYGATGSGKTYTMLGTGQQPGIMPLAIVDLFTFIENRKDKQFRMTISYLEIYNENIRDLLGNGENLEMREDHYKGIMINGLKEIEVTKSSEVFQYLWKGNIKRTTESTEANETSSRSHAILQIILENKDVNMAMNINQMICGRFLLVDLAGSERGGNNSGIRQLEGTSINKSLLALGKCINALIENKTGKNFIPWRDSKLTRLLKESLGGNSRIVMITTISPSSNAIDETVRSLHFANRAKNIQTSAKKNMIDVEYHINKYDDIISSLTAEREQLRNQLAVKTHSQHLRKSPENPNDQMNRLDKLSHDITVHFQEELQLKADIIDAEKKIDMHELTLQLKEYELYNVKFNPQLENDLRESMNTIVDQLASLKSMAVSKEMKLKEVMSRRDFLENQLSKYQSTPLGIGLRYQYDYYICEVKNLANDHIQKQYQNKLKQKDLKRNKIIIEINKHDDYVTNIKSEMNKKSVKFDFEVDEKIKSCKDLDIEKIANPPEIYEQIDAPTRIPYQSPTLNLNNVGNNSFDQVKPIKQDYPKHLQQRSISTRGRGGYIDYSGYNNPNIFKEKKVIKTKTSEIMEKSKNNQLSQLALNILNDKYKNSIVVYMTKGNKRKEMNVNNTNNIVAVDTRMLNKSNSNGNVSIQSIQSTSDYGNGTSFREREVDNKIRRIMANKHRSPFMKR